MMKPIYAPPVFRKFYTFDFEWSKGERKGNVCYPQIRLCGVWDGKAYRCYRTVAEFLEGELTRRNSGVWYYAHAGGLADMVFVFEELLKSEKYSVDASFSGSSAMIVRVTSGQYKWTFVDSLRLLPTSLANIAEFIGMEKGDVDFETENYAELRAYNEQDCRILWDAIDAFENVLRSLGGQLQMTLASCAMYLFRRKYLRGVLLTSDAVNQASRQSYIASRVEIFERECQNAVYYDINSSFPHAMTFPMPGKIRAVSRSLPDHDLSLADCTITVPPTYFPPLPYRAQSRKIYFPTGTWRSWFTGVDLRLLQETGGTIEKVHECYVFAERNDLKDFANDLYDKRKAAKDPMQTQVLKLLLNSLYGKFGERSLKTRVVCYPNEPLNGDNVSNLFPGVYLIDEEKDVPHMHVPFAAQITARARETLFRSMEQGAPFYYCDTDGFACDNPNLPTSKYLGALKQEEIISEGHFYRPKVYELKRPDGSSRIRAKGFSLKPDISLVHEWPKEEREERSRSYSYDLFQRLVNEHAIDARRFYRIRELLRLQSRGVEYRPTEATITKSLQRETPKRKFFADGSSEPWDVSEIEK